MSTFLLIAVFLLDFAAGYILGKEMNRLKHFKFGRWMVHTFQGNLCSDKYYFIVENDRSDISLVIDRNGDFDLIGNVEQCSKKVK